MIDKKNVTMIEKNKKKCLTDQMYETLLNTTLTYTLIHTSSVGVKSMIGSYYTIV